MAKKPRGNGPLDVPLDSVTRAGWLVVLATAITALAVGIVVTSFLGPVFETLEDEGRRPVVGRLLLLLPLGAGFIAAIVTYKVGRGVLRSRGLPFHRD